MILSTSLYQTRRLAAAAGATSASASCQRRSIMMTTTLRRKIHQSLASTSQSLSLATSITTQQRPFRKNQAYRSSDTATIHRRSFFNTRSTAKEQQLFMWGTDTSGSLWKNAHSQDTKVFDVPFAVESSQIEEALGANNGIKQVVCGATDTAFLTDDGSCFVMGQNKNGQLGLGHQNAVAKPERLELPSGDDSDSPKTIQQIVLGSKFSAATDQDGNLYTFGNGGTLTTMGWLGHGNADSQLRPKLVESLVEDKCTVAQVGVGETHMTVLTEEGEVLTTGHGAFGKLGNLESIDRLYLDTVAVLTPDSYNVKAISVGKSFNLALTSLDGSSGAAPGKLFAWGKNSKGQLGSGMGLSVDTFAMQEYPEPVEGEIDTLLHKRIVKMDAGHSHAAAITDQGELYFWGMSLQFDPTLVEELSGVNIVDVACGEDYTIALDESGQVYSFGQASGALRGNSGVLGQGSKVKQLTQATLMEAFDPSRHKVEQISAGWKHAACLVSIKEED